MPVAALGETVAVRVKLLPAVGVVVDTASAVVVAVVVAVPTVMETALDVLVAYAEDPP